MSNDVPSWAALSQAAFDTLAVTTHRRCCVCEKTTETWLAAGDRVLCYDCNWAGLVWAAKQAHAERRREARHVRRSARYRELLATMGVKDGDTLSFEGTARIDAQLDREEKDAAVFDTAPAALPQTGGDARPASSQQVFAGVGQLRCTAYKKINERGYYAQCDCRRGHGGPHSTVSGRLWVSGDSDTGDMSGLDENVNAYTPPPPVLQRLSEAREELGLPPLPAQDDTRFFRNDFVWPVSTNVSPTAPYYHVPTGVPDNPAPLPTQEQALVNAGARVVPLPPQGRLVFPKYSPEDVAKVAALLAPAESAKGQGARRSDFAWSPLSAAVLSTVDRLPDELMRMRTADAPPPEPAKEEPPAEPETEGDELYRFFKRTNS